MKNVTHADMCALHAGVEEATQQQLIARAFAGDDVAADFEAEKEAEAEAEGPKIEVTATTSKCHIGLSIFGTSCLHRPLNPAVCPRK